MIIVWLVAAKHWRMRGSKKVGIRLKQSGLARWVMKILAVESRHLATLQPVQIGEWRAFTPQTGSRRREKCAQLWLTQFRAQGIRYIYRFFYLKFNFYWPKVYFGSHTNNFNPRWPWQNVYCCQSSRHSVPDEKKDAIFSDPICCLLLHQVLESPKEDWHL